MKKLNRLIKKTLSLKDRVKQWRNELDGAMKDASKEMNEYALGIKVKVTMSEYGYVGVVAYKGDMILPMILSISQVQHIIDKEGFIGEEHF